MRRILILLIYRVWVLRIQNGRMILVPLYIVRLCIYKHKKKEQGERAVFPIYIVKCVYIV